MGVQMEAEDPVPTKERSKCGSKQRLSNVSAITLTKFWDFGDLEDEANRVADGLVEAIGSLKQCLRRPGSCLIVLSYRAAVPCCQFRSHT